MRLHCGTHNADIEPARTLPVFVSKIRFTCSYCLRRKLKCVTSVKVMALLMCSANRCGRSNYFRTKPFAATKPIYCRLIQTDNRTQRPGYQMQFVLDDQSWRRRFGSETEKPSNSVVPGYLSK